MGKIFETEKARKKGCTKEQSCGLLAKAPIQEFYEGEQHDLVVNVLKKSLQSYDPRGRAYELISGMLDVNKEQGNGRAIFEGIRSLLSKGQALTKRELGEFKRMGFDVTSDGKHYKLKFHGSSKYLFTLSKSPGDDRFGKNLISDISKKLSVYK